MTNDSRNEDKTSEEGARPSSLIPVHKLATPDRLYDLQLLRDLAIINERTARELGPMPPGGLPVIPKRKPKSWRHDEPAVLVNQESVEDETMKLSHAAMVAALGVAVAGSVTAEDEAGVDLSPKAMLSQDNSKNSSVIDGIQMPKEVISFIGKEDVVLAYKEIDLIGSGGDDIAIILRHHEKNSATQNNPCDLLIFHKESDEIHLAGRNGRVVDCEFNDENIEAKQLELNDSLELSQREIKFTNDNLRGGWYSYTFRLFNGGWYAYAAASVYKSEGNADVSAEFIRETASYPKDFGLTSMADFDPDSLRAVMSKNKSLIP